MAYEKCRQCRFVCKCCTSHDCDTWPRCSECPNNRFEFQPASHIQHCPLDGSELNRPLYDINGRLIKED